MADTPIEGAPEAAPVAQEPPATSGGAPSLPVLMLDRFQIYPSRPLPELSTPSASAFAAEDRRDIGRRLCAYVCTPGLPSRIGAAALLRGGRVRNLMALVEFGTVDWPPIGQRSMVMIYERPLGGKLTDSESAATRGQDVQQRVIEPLANALQEMADHRMPHRAIRPDNIFFLDEEKQTVVLGECLTSPPGFDQPLVFETIKNGLADPAGRDEGDLTDDMYAFGVTLVFYLLGENPVANYSDDQLIYAKAEQGTYATLCSGGRIPLTMLELLRGLLSDDPAERWGVHELALWIDGRRMTPIQKRAATRPETRFSFAGHDHITTRTLAHAFSRNVSDAARVLKERQLDPWLRRSLVMKELADAVAGLADSAYSEEGNARGVDELLVSRVCMLLDPEAPIRYLGYAFHPDSFGTSLAVELLRQNTTRVGEDILERNIVGLWFEVRNTIGSMNPAQERNYQNLQDFLLNKNPGYGIERCLYDLNPGFPCQSPFIVKDFVSDVDSLLAALDEAANRVDTKAPPMDRHIAAFIAAHFEHDVEKHLRALGDADDAKSITGMLSLLSAVQWRMGPDALFGLSSWVGGLLGPAINSYHSRTVRGDIEREIPRLVRQGSLPGLFDLIDNAEQRHQDRLGYDAAINEFVLAENEIQEIESSDSARSESAERIGQQSSAMTSVVITLIFITIVFLNEVW
ncbi:MAG: hypothetical protein HN403_00615 [Rhodospirillales bacterium]|jgi:hypothetical protein|nr:hypothetical protein [Rhodospirillales bacterium]